MVAQRLTPPPSQKLPTVKIRWKVLVSIFWDQGGIFLIDYLPKGRTINVEYYSPLLVLLKDILKEKFLRNFYFLHDNAPVNRSLATQKKLTYLSFQCLDRQTYSPELAPSNYHLHRGLQKQLKFCHFSCGTEDIAAAETWLDGQLLSLFLMACKR
jgi:hypothetical protein